MTTRPTVLITGASSGIGATYAERFAQRGHDLVLVARDKSRLDALAARLRDEHKVAIDVLQADLTQQADLAAVEARLRNDTRIGILINNAGIAQSGGFAQQTAESIERLITLNTTALTRLAAAVAPRFVQSGAGSIVNIGSVVGFAPEFGMSIYGATKAFVLFLSQGLNLELSPKGVYVQAVLPATDPHRDLGACRRRRQHAPRSDGSRRTGRCGAGRLRPPRTGHDPAAARGWALGCAGWRASRAAVGPSTSKRSRALSATSLMFKPPYSESHAMPYLLRTGLCLLALSAALASPFAAAGDAIAADGSSTAATATQGARWRDAPTQIVSAGGVDFAYRELGQHKGGTPVVLLVHLAAVLDNWDPRVVDGFAAKHHVVAFDNRGIGASTGAPANTIEQMADDAIAFIRAKGFKQVDLFGFSMGGMIAQEIVLKEPGLVRKLILAGTGPAGGPGISTVAGVANYDLLRATFTGQDPKQYLFFTRTPNGIEAGKAFLKRLQERTGNRDKDITIGAYVAQLQALSTWGQKRPADLSAVRHPVLVANGDDDRMVPTTNSYDLAKRLPNSQLLIYPDAGHGGVFQYHEDFVPKALAFLAQ